MIYFQDRFALILTNIFVACNMIVYDRVWLKFLGIEGLHNIDDTLTVWRVIRDATLPRYNTKENINLQSNGDSMKIKVSVSCGPFIKKRRKVIRFRDGPLNSLARAIVKESSDVAIIVCNLLTGF